MIRDRLARAMAETLVNKVVMDIKSDPERGLRNIIDLALMVPRGKFSQNLFGIVQRILADEKSAYYTLVKKVAGNVDSENLKKFTFNIGYNSCTCGARYIRSNTNTLGFPIPWSISINMSFSDNSTGAIKKIISEGKSLGIYLYMIYGKNCIANSMSEIYRDNDECAFIIFADSDEISDINKLEGINNILISINGSDRKIMAQAADSLHRYSRFFACHRFYNDSNIDLLTSDKELESAEDFTNSFVFYLPEDNCSIDGCIKMKSCLRSLRDSQKYAYIPIDLRSDLPEIDDTICKNSYSIYFREDKRISISNGLILNKVYDISTCSLSDILKDMHLYVK